MNFFCISRPDQTDTIYLLKKACEKLNVNFVLVDPNEFSPDGKYIPTKGDLMYRVSDTFYADVMELEYFYIGHGVTTFYENNNPLLVNLEESDSFLLPLKGIKTPKTFFFLPQHREVLNAVVEDLGGYPIVIKALGGSHGVGVMRIDSVQSLNSVLDFLRRSGKRCVLKEYIHIKETARIIVLGDKVIDSIKYISPKNDFRSNEGEIPNFAAGKFSKAVESMAIEAVKALGLEFGGVDILIDETQSYVTEVNFPCYFPRAEMFTGSPIAEEMIRYLIDKSKK